MPKIYDQNKDPERESRNRGTLGEPDSPEKVQKRNIALVIAAILAIVIVMIFYRVARGDEIQGAATFAEPTTISATAEA